ncbi:hypothetical protein [Nocardioides sp. 503]|uniref:hypothetical protein n=1 Tax=Nocardioides sp. 503 TaxID=2508326 RepID=UPI00106FE75E|nr:hypothetical protein [Nocardioides sp. 503]
MRAALLGALVAVAAASVVTPSPALAAGGGGEPPEDLTPPVLTITRPPGAVDGWYAGPVAVGVRATDDHLNAAGVRSVSWALSGAQTGTGMVSRTEGGTVSVTNSGPTTLDVEAVDGNDNSTFGQVSIGIDRTPPVVTFRGRTVPGGEIVQGTSATLAFDCAEQQSGLGGCVGTFAPGTPVDTSVLGPQTISVRAWDRVGNEVTRSATYTVVDDEFTILRSPQVAGTPAIGQTLTAVDPQVSPAPTGHTYEWLRETDGVNTVVGTGRTHAVTAADAGSHLRVRVSPVREGVAPRPLTSSHVTVPLGRITPTTQPALEGLALLGRTLTTTWLTVTGPDAVTVAYAWLRDGAVVEGATSREYSPTQADLGHRLRARIQVSAPGYETLTILTDPSDVVRGRPLQVVGSAGLRGTARVGELLRATVPRIQEPPEQRGPGDPATLSYQWLRDGAAIPGARAATYRLLPADSGRRISVRVRGSLPGHEDAVVTSAASAPVAIGLPVVTARLTPGAPGKARVVVAVRLPGVTPGGSIVVTRGGRTVLRGVLRGGALRAVLTRQPRGKVTYRVRYAGAPGLASRAVAVSTRIR